MFTGIAVIIIVILFIIVVSIYQHYVLMYYQCVTEPTIWCYNDWSCEANPNRIGGLDCEGGDCKNTINGFYNGENRCADSCNASGGCGCQWPEQFTVPVQDNGAPCSVAKYGNIGPGAFTCGQSDSRCPEEGEGCIPNCETMQEGCCPVYE